MRISTDHRLPYRSARGASGASGTAAPPAAAARRRRMARSGRVRIIGGQWRGRVLHFPAVPGLRPTLDRARETLFNWLTPHVEGAHCLDLCCGSGALGLESLSRGAASVTLVDHAAPVREYLGRVLHHLQAQQRAFLVHADARVFLRRPPRPARRRYDIVFLDPPYGGRLLYDCCRLLERSDLLAERAFLYLEQDRPAAQSPVAHYLLHRQRRCGQLWLQLYRGAALPNEAPRHTLAPD